MNEYLRIICCCGSGLGSSLILSLNIDNYIKNHKLKNISVSHSSISEVNKKSADIVVVGLDVYPLFLDYNKVVVIKDIISYEELDSKLTLALNNKEEKYLIK
ncbi:MAG: PTS sugar transporter subunit IIB [Erysipelotrichaceae bacterium]|nr:PTS sugar transporter subunit IIB [Erysipelotrichaceae bacterium]MDY3830450.1 PTS sugar transporter subunit IIB [Erysipelotrichaceae bacterium]MDY5727369.1 PTS sugar transporter subunit IIB [Erysipelotrichaceae bacterium]